MIYLKLLGAIAVCLCGALIGHSRSVFEKECTALTADLSACLTDMADEIATLQTPLPQLMRRISSCERPAAPFFGETLKNMEIMPLGEAWKSALPSANLPTVEHEIMSALAAGFGKYDAHSQASELNLAASRLEKQVNIRRETIRRQGKLSTVLGASLGAMCAIMLL